MEKINVTKATPVKVETQEDGDRRAAAISDSRIMVSPKKLPPGIGFTRLSWRPRWPRAIPCMALEIFKGRRAVDGGDAAVAGVLKTAVTAGSTSDTTWGGPLVNYQILTGEFIEYLRPLTIIGRIPGLTRVPFKVKIPRQTGGATVNWVGEGAPKPLTSLAFDSVTLDFAKIAGIIVINQELARLATPSAELWCATIWRRLSSSSWTRSSSIRPSRRPPVSLRRRSPMASRRRSQPEPPVRRCVPT
jgi:hypothetical protein